MKKAVLRQLNFEPPSVRKQFKLDERERIQKLKAQNLYEEPVEVITL